MSQLCNWNPFLVFFLTPPPFYTSSTKSTMSTMSTTSTTATTGRSTVPFILFFIPFKNSTNKTSYESNTSRHVIFICVLAVFSIVFGIILWLLSRKNQKPTIKINSRRIYQTTKQRICSRM